MKYFATVFSFFCGRTFLKKGSPTPSPKTSLTQFIKTNSSVRKQTDGASEPLAFALASRWVAKRREGSE